MILRVQRVSAYIVAILGVSWSPQASADNRSPDFDNDNKDDLAVGVPVETANGVQAGVVNVLYGGTSGLDDKTGRITTLWRGTPNVEEDPEAGDGFGHSLAWGDFDGDCFDDLSVGLSSGGLVHVFYGSTTGLSAADDDVLNHPTFVSQAAGDFNGDGFDDLALFTGWDEVTVVYGSATGLNDMAGPGFQIWDRAELGLHEFVEPEDSAQMGWSLATGDFNCDGIDDLAMGAPWDAVDPMTSDREGMVYVLYGTPLNGLTTAGFQAWDQSSSGILGTPEDGDRFGWSLAVGNFDNNSSEGRACHDLAIGVPFEDVVTPGTDHGLVHVLYGTAANGLQTSSPAPGFWHTDIMDVEGSPLTHWQFGWTLVAGNMDGDAFEDLAISVLRNDAIAILRGSSGGIVATDDVLWDRASPNIPGAVQASEGFGRCLAYGKEWHSSFDRGLGVCAPFSDQSSETEAGALTVLYLNGTTAPAASSSSVTLTQADLGDLVEAGDWFTWSTLAPRDRPFTTGVCD